MDIELLLAETELSDKVQFPHPVAENWSNPGAVFLTGATGFLGVYLLAELLQQTDADIYCLVRADDGAAGSLRIRQQLQFYRLWQDAFAQRIVPVVGDLSLPSLGLSERDFADLGARIDVIYHNGAQVNAMYAYERLKASNVSGTLEVLRLAGLTRTKPVNYVSTQAVFFSDRYVDQVVLENQQANLDAGLKGGYKQSKWVAESLVDKARERGLPVVISRPGRILGHSQTGIIERLSDLLVTLLLGSLQLEQFPQVETQVNFAPVDYVSRAIVYLGGQSRALNQNFHVCHPHSIDWHSLWAIIASLDYSLTGVTFEHWRQAVNAQAKCKADQQLYRMLNYMLRTPIYLFAAKPRFDTRQTQMLLADSGMSCPPVDAQLMATYLQYCQKSGYLPLLNN